MARFACNGRSYGSGNLPGDLNDHWVFTAKARGHPMAWLSRECEKCHLPVSDDLSALNPHCTCPGVGTIVCRRGSFSLTNTEGSRSRVQVNNPLKCVIKVQNLVS